jgi:tetratricopeptide (TPR) repeat protein
MSPKKTRLVLISGGLLVFVLLFIAPKIKPVSMELEEASVAKAGVSDAATLDVYLNLAQKNMEPELKKQLDQLIASRRNDSLSAFWDRLKRPDLASVYAEEQAKAENTAAAWFKAGNRYYYAVQFSKDKTEIPVLYQCAMRCFNKGLTLEPNNTDARIMLASCYVEGSADPMEGINRLRQIEKTDSNNVKLQLTFAFFSVKSGQLDRAIARFNKVLSADSTYIEAYLHLADAYEQLGETENTIKALEAYAARTPEVTARNEINKYIQQLKNK